MVAWVVTLDTGRSVRYTMFEITFNITVQKKLKSNGLKISTNNIKLLLWG